LVALPDSARQWSQIADRWKQSARLYSEAMTASYRAEENAQELAIIIFASLAAGRIEATEISTAAYRNALGITGPQTHVDHLFPRSLGGIDHPLNYQAITAQENLALGARLFPKFLQNPLGFTRGCLISLFRHPALSSA